jgi:YVTN family beta-propeller protein
VKYKKRLDVLFSVLIVIFSFLAISTSIVSVVIAQSTFFRGQYAYVTGQSSNTVSVIDTVKNAVIATVPIGEPPTKVRVVPDGATPSGVAAAQDGKKVYVANFGSDIVSVIETKQTMLQPRYL